MNAKTRFVVIVGLCLMGCASALGQTGPPAWTKAESQIRDQISHLRSLPDDVRAKTTRQIALDIRALPKSVYKLSLAVGLANLSTEGDFGKETLQEVTTTLASAVRERPVAPEKDGGPASAYVSLAQLARYEHMRVRLKDPQLAAATALLVAADE